MQDGFNVDKTTKITEERQDFNIHDSQSFTIDVKDSMAIQANKLAEHEGKIAGLSSVVAALQSYKGFLQGVILAGLALSLAGFGLVINLQFSGQAKLVQNVDSVSGDVKALSSRMSTIETKMDALPSQVSKEIREASRDMAILSREARETEQRSD